MEGDAQWISLPGQFELLLVLIARAGRLLSREQLLDLTSRGSDDAFDRSIDVLMSRLRKKLGENEAFSIIKTVRNGGYIFAAPVDATLRIEDAFGHSVPNLAQY
jgi:DNA-binding response OmpR family regulator